MPVVVFVALAAGMSYAAQHHVRGFERDLRQQVEGELSAVADLWVAQAAEWRRGLLEEATVLVEGSGREREVAALFTGSGSEHDRESLLFSLQRRQRRQKALVASLVDEAGRRVVTTSDERESPPYEREALKRAGRAGRAILVDEPGHPQDLLAVAPVYSERGEFEGGVVLAARVSEALPALVSGRSGPFPGTEVDLGLVEGETVQVVSLAGGDPGAAPNRTVALADAEPIAMAARGEVGISSLRDASGKKVIAARRQVTGSPWVLVTEVREADLLAPATERARSLTVAVGSLLLAAGVALLAWWRGVSAGLARRRRALDERALHLRLEYLWKHANDIVVLSALDGRILDANDRALAAYGYTREELRSLRSSDLRPPELRADHAVLSRLETQGALLFETVHRRKDGSTFP
ncbi:MAG TPA: PAS domain S-box protein, partial [Anaeromyxobacteraceae bacterium]|nr:PAS domain S-box protein [Anaeromyxobacteraceae bacterium]